MRCLIFALATVNTVVCVYFSHTRLHQSPAVAAYDSIATTSQENSAKSTVDYSHSHRPEEGREAYGSDEVFSSCRDHDSILCLRINDLATRLKQLIQQEGMSNDENISISANSRMHKMALSRSGHRNKKKPLKNMALPENRLLIIAKKRAAGGNDSIFFNFTERIMKFSVKSALCSFYVRPQNSSLTLITLRITFYFASDSNQLIPSFNRSIPIPITNQYGFWYTVNVTDIAKDWFHGNGKHHKIEFTSEELSDPVATAVQDTMNGYEPYLNITLEDEHMRFKRGAGSGEVPRTCSVQHEHAEIECCLRSRRVSLSNISSNIVSPDFIDIGVCSGVCFLLQNNAHGKTARITNYERGPTHGCCVPESLGPKSITFFEKRRSKPVTALLAAAVIKSCKCV